MWHDVKKELPMVGQNVLVKTKKGKITISKRVGYYYVNVFEKERWQGSEAFSNSIVSWCEIP